MLILAGTPIGNLGDASSRLVDTLRAADLIACEDTRTTAKLLGLLEVTERPKLIALHEHNEHEAADEVARLAAEQTVVLVSDAGMPAISDPGFRVVRACAEAGVTVTSVPGPSAVITALAVAGLPTDRFCFEGFVPRKQTDRAKLIEQLADEPRTTVLYESPHRLATTLDDFAAAWPERQVVVCRELTKLHEEVRRGTCAERARACGARSCSCSRAPRRARCSSMTPLPRCCGSRRAACGSRMRRPRSRLARACASARSTTRRLRHAVRTGPYDHRQRPCH
jgi:16S rRNA (cytidine1402-2'-O)-methyltransferase